MPSAEEKKSNRLGYASVVLGVLGVLIAAYAYQESIREREPSFIIDPVRTEILRSDQVLGVPIRVTRTDGTEIKSDLSSVRFYLWNNGKESIRDSDVLQQISIRFDDPNVRIVYPTILKISHEVAGIRVTPDLTNPEKALLISFKILEKNDGVTGQIIYEGSTNARLVISGIIEGVESFRSESVFQKRARRAGYIFFAFALVILSTMFIGALRAAFHWLNTTSVHVRKNRVRLILIVLLVATFSGVTYAFFNRSMESVKRLSEKVVANAVPANILP